MSLRLRPALSLVYLVASATLIRSILYDRWITVLASALLLVGAVAARRGKTWGIGVALGAAAAFPMARVLGMAPAWFWAVGAIGALPFALTSRALARFDAKATAFGASLAMAAGLLGAVGWRVFAPSLIAAFPALRPSFWPAHEALAAFTMGALALFGWASQRVAASALAPAEVADALASAPPPAALRLAPAGRRVPDAPPSPDAVEVASSELDDEPPARLRSG
ncbi:MAG: hypothetical protein MUF34_17390 [Polyangiaceae bacterium]|nr:hypothetical protein [Polyangiaceae bacterium]